MAKVCILDGRKFAAVETSGSGDVDAQTVFHYHQVDDYLYGTYGGGRVMGGVFIGRVEDSLRLKFTYTHYDQDGHLRQGKCQSRIEQLPDGRLRLHEKWRWSHGNRTSGESIIEEIQD